MVSKTEETDAMRKASTAASNRQSISTATPSVRTIVVDGSVPASSPQTGFKNNSISTTKYNVFTFVPKFLFEQFQKYANIFFLFISIIQVSLIFKDLWGYNTFFFLCSKSVIFRQQTSLPPLDHCLLFCFCLP